MSVFEVPFTAAKVQKRFNIRKSISTLYSFFILGGRSPSTGLLKEKTKNKREGTRGEIREHWTGCG